MTGAIMWQRFVYRGQEVTVVQQWVDPFGRKMVGLASAATDEEDAAVGMGEDVFLATAEPIDRSDYLP